MQYPKTFVKTAFPLDVEIKPLNISHKRLHYFRNVSRLFPTNISRYHMVYWKNPFLGSCMQNNENKKIFMKVYHVYCKSKCMNFITATLDYHNIVLQQNKLLILMFKVLKVLKSIIINDLPSF